MFGCRDAAFSNARSISRPVTSFACKMRRLEWPPSLPRSSCLPPSSSRRVALGKFHSQLDQLRNARRAFLDDGADDVFLAQSRARRERVAHVQLERILLARDRRDAALRVIRVRLRAVLFGDDGHASARRDLQRKESPAMPLPRTRKSNFFMRQEDFSAKTQRCKVAKQGGKFKFKWAQRTPPPTLHEPFPN